MLPKTAPQTPLADFGEIPSAPRTEAEIYQPLVRVLEFAGRLKIMTHLTLPDQCNRLGAQSSIQIVTRSGIRAHASRGLQKYT